MSGFVPPIGEPPIPAAPHPPSHWLVRGATAQGDAHRSRNVVCQDAHYWAEHPGADGSTRTYVLATADGAGSRPRSAEGARSAVEVGVQKVLAGLSAGPLPADGPGWRALVRDSFQRTHATVNEHFQQHENPADFATTLTLAVVHGHHVAWAAVGDGFLVLRTGRGPDALFHVADTERRIGSRRGVDETTFLTSERALEVVRVHGVHDPDITGVLLSTDGLESPFLRAPVGEGEHMVTYPMVRAVMEFFDHDPGQPDEMLLDFLNNPELSKYTQDDKTVVVAVTDDQS